ncbi:MAG: FkbM family methyltransferase [Actinobacteria bacterium]|nr:FkbM family methyltransferase [Actinomycetota bacterium]
MVERLRTIRSFIKAFGFKLFLHRVVNALILRPFKIYILHSYSQNREDLIIDKLLGHKKKGFYVDVGAYDPVRSNNTMKFYRKNWSGINIEPDSTCLEKIASRRKRDMNLNIGIGSEFSKGTLYSFLPATRSTFSEAVARELIEKGLTLTGKNEVEIWPLSLVFEKYRPDQGIDFLSIDTEGYDLQVIKSNDWKRFKPEVICIESDGGDEAHRYLINIGYDMVAGTADNSIYKLSKQPNLNNQ